MEIGVQRHASTTVFSCLSEYLGVRRPAEPDVVNVNCIPSRADQDRHRGARSPFDCMDEEVGQRREGCEVEKQLNQAAPTVRT